MVGCPSVRPSVCPVDRRLTLAAASAQGCAYSLYLAFDVSGTRFMPERREE